MASHASSMSTSDKTCCSSKSCANPTRAHDDNDDHKTPSLHDAFPSEHQCLPVLPTVVINLPHRTDRWATLSDHLSAVAPSLPFQMDIHRIDGVKNLMCPTKGCMISHANAIRMAKENKWECLMVLEDDARLNADAWQTCWRDLATEPSWHILWGGSTRVIPSQCRRFASNIPFNNVLLLRPGGVWTATHCMIYRACCYDVILDEIDAQVQAPDAYDLDLALSQLALTRQLLFVLPVPYVAHFLGDGTSDVRRNKDVTLDFQLLTNAERTAVQITRPAKPPTQ